MSGRSLNGNSFTNNVFVNSMFQEGTAISITQQSENTKVIVNLDIGGLSANTTTNTSDVFVLEESGGNTKKITYGNLTSSLVSLTGTETLQNKSMKLPFKILDTSNDHNYTFAVSELVADRTITLPLLGGNDEFVFKDHTATLTNKTISTGSTWSGNTIATTSGGTGLSSYTTGDIIYSSSGNTLAKLNIGSTGQVLKVSGGVPVWGTDNDTIYTATTPINVSGTTISLQNLSGFGSNGDYLKTNGSDTISYSSFTTDANTAIANATSVASASTSTDRHIGVGIANMNINSKLLCLYGVDSNMSADAVGFQLKGSVSVGGTFTDMTVLELTNRYSASATSNKPQLKFRDFTGSIGTTTSYVGPDSAGNLHYQDTDEIAERADNFGTTKGADINIGSTGYTTNINTKISSTKEGAENDISFLNGKLFNNNIASSSGFRSVNINMTGFSGYGFGTFTDFGSDVYMYVANSGFKYASIGSITSDGIFALYAGNETALTINPNERNHISIGKHLVSSANFTPLGVVHIKNITTSPDDADTTVIIESVVFNKMPKLEFIQDTGTGSGTTKSGHIRFDATNEKICFDVIGTDRFEIYHDGVVASKYEFDNLYGMNSTENYIEHNSTYGFGFYGKNDGGRSYNMFLKNTGSGANYGWIGCDSQGLFLHMNGLGDALEMIKQSNKATIKITNALSTGNPISTGLTAGQSAGNLDTPIRLGSTYSYGSANQYYQNIGFYTPHLSNNHWTIFTFDSTTNTHIGFSNKTSQLATLDDLGNWSIAGSFSSSDKRIKENIETADLNEVKTIFDKLDLKSYNYNQSYRDRYHKTDKKVYGFIADEVKEIDEISYLVKTFPISGITDNDGNEMNDILELNKDRLLTLLWGMVKYQQQEINTSKETINKQQEETNTLKNEVNSLKDILNKLTTATTFANFKKSLNLNNNE